MPRRLRRTQSSFASEPVAVPVESMGVRPHDPHGRYAHGADVRAVEVGRRGWNAAAGVVRIAFTGWRRLRCRRPAAACRDGMIGVEDGRGARLPESAPGRLRAPRLCASAMPHSGLVRLCRSTGPPRRAGRLDVRIHAVPFHVPKQSAVAVSPVKASIALQNDLRTDWREAEQRRSRRARVALAGAQLRSIDLQQTHPPPIAKRERVAVIHRRDHANFSVLRLATRSRAGRAESRQRARSSPPRRPVPRAVVQSPRPQRFRSFSREQ